MDLQGGWAEIPKSPPGPSQFQSAQTLHSSLQQKFDANISLRTQGSRDEGTTLLGVTQERKPRAQQGWRVCGEKRG